MNNSDPCVFDASMKDWANEQLKFGISLLRGKFSSFAFTQALSDAIGVRDRLRGRGAVWQADKLTIWINKARKEGDFLPLNDKPRYDLQNEPREFCPLERSDGGDILNE